MRMLPLLSLLAAGALAACARDASSPAPTEPPLEAHKGSTPVTTTTTACSATVADQVSAQIDLLFTGGARSNAQRQFRAIKSACPSKLDKAITLTVELIDFSLDAFPPGPSQSRADDVVTLWRLLSLFVTPDTPISATGTVLTQGTAAVCGSDGCSGILRAVNGLAGLVVHAGSVDGPHLFGFSPATCFSTTLNVRPHCFDFFVYPTDAIPFAVPVTVINCPAINVDPTVQARALGAHPSAPGSDQVLVAPPDDNVAFHCEDVAATFGANDSFLDRLSNWASAILTPRTLEAGHLGQGSLSKGFSIWGLVDPLTFSADFEHDAVGAPPQTPDVGLAWLLSITDPGSITVQNALGDDNTRLVVLDQKGGASANSGGLFLRGRLSVPQTTGIFRVRWRSLIATPTVKLATFFVRASNGAAIAQLAYIPPRTGAHAGLLTFDGDTLNVGWTQNVSQRFEFEVDLNARTVRLVSIDGQPVTRANGQPLGAKPFLAAAADLGAISVELVGIDAQIVGWDDLAIDRLPDPVGAP